MINDDTRRWVFQRDWYTYCFLQARRQRRGTRGRSLSAVAQGGTDHGNNLQTTCWPCNALKGDRKTKAFDAWLRYNFASRAHYARYTTAARANRSLPEVDGNSAASLRSYHG